MPDEAVRPFINAAVEGQGDEAVARRLISHVGAQIGGCHGLKGKSHLRGKIAGYNNAARYEPWLVLVDLDNDAGCAPSLREAWLPDPAPLLCLRVAVREVEAWLMADAESLARYLSVSRGRIPRDPESLDDPKGTMATLARSSRRREIREGMAPRDGSGRPVGPAYTGKLIEYAETEWCPEIAARNSESLRRTLRCLHRVVADHGGPAEA